MLLSRSINNNSYRTTTSLIDWSIILAIIGTPSFCRLMAAFINTLKGFKRWVFWLRRMNSWVRWMIWVVTINLLIEIWAAFFWQFTGITTSHIWMKTLVMTFSTIFIPNAIEFCFGCNQFFILCFKVNEEGIATISILSSFPVWLYWFFWFKFNFLNS